MASTADDSKQKHIGQSVAAARRTARQRRHARLRKKVSGTPDRPRLVVNRSARHMFAQIVDDSAGRTLAAAVEHHGCVAALADGAREGGLKL